MKILEKGSFGYIQNRKQRYLLYALAEFAIVLAVFALGIIQTGSRKNVLTIVAIVGCLPASKMLVEYFVMMPFHGTTEQVSRDLQAAAGQMKVVYDLLVSTKDKMMLVDAAVISEYVVCGYYSDGKTDEKKVRAHLKKTLADGGYENVTVKLMSDYSAYLARVKEMQTVADARPKKTGKLETEIARILLTTCM